MLQGRQSANAATPLPKYTINNSFKEEYQTENQICHKPQRKLLEFFAVYYVS